MSGRDWRNMTRGDFDSDAPVDALFELAPGSVPAVDACDTADMLELLGSEDGTESP